MRALKLFTFLLFISIPALSKAQMNSAIRIDTIGQSPGIWLDTAVTSFKVCVILPGGIATERYCRGNTFYYGATMKPGTVVIVDQIISRTQAGGTVRLPARKFVVR